MAIKNFNFIVNNFYLSTYFPGRARDNPQDWQVVRVIDYPHSNYDCYIQRVTFDLLNRWDKESFPFFKHTQFGCHFRDLKEISFTDPDFVKIIKMAIFEPMRRPYFEFLSKALKEQVGVMPIPLLSSKDASDVGRSNSINDHAEVEVGGINVEPRPNAIVRPRVVETTTPSASNNWIRNTTLNP